MNYVVEVVGVWVVESKGLDALYWNELETETVRSSRLGDTENLE